LLRYISIFHQSIPVKRNLCPFCNIYPGDQHKRWSTFSWYA